MTKTELVCTECGHRTLQELGRCPTCGAWSSFVVSGQVTAPKPTPLAGVASSGNERLSTGLVEFDRVLGGGLVKGSVVLVAGEPGVGKSSLMLQTAAGLEDRGRRVLLICGEESLEQVAARAARLGGPKKAEATTTTAVDLIAAMLAGADVAIVDSVQALRDSTATGDAGSVTQVRSCAATLTRAARASNCAVVLVGHVTKDGGVAGPRTLEHLVDVVITFEGDRGHALRTIRGVKNRFGPTDELGVFEMGPSGLNEIADPSALFLADRREGVAGSAVGCVIEGRRPVALEVQALVNGTDAMHPRRVTQGLEASRLGLALAVLEARGQVLLRSCDVYASVAGGLRAVEPGIDLALALAIAGAALGKFLPPQVGVIGELGLGGEVRAVPAMGPRVKELTRLGFTKIVVPASAEVHGVESIGVKHIGQALTLLRDHKDDPSA